MFHGESNFKEDEGVILNNTGFISLNDLYLAMRHEVLFNSTFPSLFDYRQTSSNQRIRDFRDIQGERS